MRSVRMDERDDEYYDNDRHFHGRYRRYLEKQFCIPPRVVALRGVDIRNFAGAPLAREKQLIILSTIYHINKYIYNTNIHTPLRHIILHIV